MAASPSQIQSVLESFLTSAIQKMVEDTKLNDISDIYLQADAESGELQVYDEAENLVDKTIIFDWVNNSEEESVFNKRVASAVKQALSALASKNVFENSHFVKPLSISLTDESFVDIEELLFLDDDTLRLDDPLLKDLDADLDDFLAKLLSDVE